MNEQRTRIAIVGAGFMGEAHIQACLANPFVELAAVCDSSEARLHELGRLYPGPRHYQEHADLFRQEHLDGVIIATPDPDHLAPVQAAAAAGVQILLEKPLATTLADAQAILDTVQQAGVILLMGFTLRHDPAFQALHHQVRQGVIGQPTHMYAKRQCRLGEGRRLGHRVTVLEYLGVHDIDLILWTMGPEVKSVYSACGTFALADLETPDFYWTTIQWQSGATAVIHSSWAMSDAHPLYVEATLELFGTQGALFVNNPGNRFYLCGPISCAYSAPDRAVKLREQVSHFDACIRGKTAPLASGADGWNALAVVRAAEESIRVGHPVPVELIRP